VKAISTELLQSVLTPSADQISILPQQLEPQFVFPRLQPKSRNAGTPSVEVWRWTRGARWGHGGARWRHDCSGRCRQQSSRMLVLVSDGARTWQLWTLYCRDVSKETLERTGCCSRVVCEVTKTWRKKWRWRSSVVRAREMGRWCWVVTEVAPRQYGARRQWRVPATHTEGSCQTCRTRAVEGFPEAEAEMRERIWQGGRHDC
jgi:hypothetical protein